jgi:hypothetical protein
MKNVLIIVVVTLLSTVFLSGNKVSAGTICYPYDYSITVDNLDDYKDYIFIADQVISGQNLDVFEIVKGENDKNGVYDINASTAAEVTHQGMHSIYAIKKSEYDNLNPDKITKNKAEDAIITYPGKFIKSDSEIFIDNCFSPFGGYGSEVRFKKRQDTFHIAGDINGKYYVNLIKITYTSKDGSHEVITGNNLSYKDDKYPLRYKIEYWLSVPSIVLFLLILCCCSAAILVLLFVIIRALSKRIKKT